MSIKKTALDYLPKEEEWVLVQVKIPVKMHQELSQLIKRKNSNWSHFIRACLERALDEIKMLGKTG